MADSTLAEIIKQKRMKRFNTGNQQVKNFNQKKVGVQGKMMNKNKGRLFKEVQKDLGINTLKKPLSISTDARNKIIHKQRTKFKDARDRLAQIAKQGDARDKLNKLRKNKPGEKVVPQQKKATVVKKRNVNVPRQASRVGQVQQGQTRMKGAAVIRTVAGSDPMRKKKVFVKGRPGVMKNAVIMTKGNQRQGGRSHPLANNPGVITIRNNNANVYDNAFDVVDYRQDLQLASRAQPFSGGMGVPSPMDTMIMREPVIRSRPVQEVYYEPEVRPSRLRITAANTDYRVSGQYVDQYEPQAWEPPTGRIQRKREYYDPSEYQVYPKKMAPVAAPVVQAEPGTKVVVSNLHLCVSVEDMEELFGTIGPVHSVRMVRQGVAEAMFVNHDDAYRSVDLFNNRQLDGQPMKVMVVRKKTPMNNSSVQARSVLRNARGRSGYY